MKNFLKENLIFIFSILILFTAILLVFFVSFFENGRHFVYSFDDAYIHMAMAKNFSMHGVWGVTQYEFTSSSSSLLWTLLLTLIYIIFAPNTFAPLILNMIFAVLLLGTVWIIMKRESIANKHIFIVLFLMIFLLPLIPLIFTGLEHVLHIWVSILFVYLISRNVFGGRIYSFCIVFLAMLIPLIRYEGIVLVLAGIIVLLLRKRYLLSFSVFLSAFLPIYIFGYISILKGWSFFPNSMVLKGGFPDIASFGDFAVFLLYLGKKFFDKPNVVFIFILVLVFSGFFICFLFRKRKTNFIRSNGFIMLILLLVNICLYIIYAGSGWSYRYQSFLIALGILVLSILLIENKNWVVKLRGSAKYSILITVILLPVFYFLYVGAILTWNTPIAMNNIYDQQYQMGKFIEKFYNGSTIALNDIGTTNYFADIKCIDLWGLSNIEVSKKMRDGSYNEVYISNLTRKNNVAIAILYDSWFSEGNGTIIPKEWMKVGEWKIQDNVIAGDDVVSFYAVKPGGDISLITNLKSYSKLLPADVVQSGIYLSQ